MRINDHFREDLVQPAFADVIGIRIPGLIGRVGAIPERRSIDEIRFLTTSEKLYDRLRAPIKASEGIRTIRWGAAIELDLIVVPIGRGVCSNRGEEQKDADHR
jgi:hypothetical protein